MNLIRAFRWSIFLMLWHVGRTAADTGDDTVNNFVSNLAPFLSLLGERQLMQFLSQALGISDSIMVAMCPTGVPTLIVSAIRVAGPNWLKAVIGRARENLSAAEIEIMSSTSNETCELWNGQMVVRCQGLGSGGIQQLITLIPKTWNDKKPHPKIEFKSIQEAEKEGLICEFKLTGFGHLETLLFSTLEEIATPSKNFSNFFRRTFAHRQKTAVDGGNTEEHGGQGTPDTIDLLNARTSPSISDGRTGLNSTSESTHSGPAATDQRNVRDTITILQDDDDTAPNLTLNCHERPKRSKTYFAAASSLVCQCILIIFACIISEHPLVKRHFLKNGQPVPSWAFLCYIGATFISTIGCLLCAIAIEKSTVEKYYKPLSGNKMRATWIQQNRIVDNQVFPSSAIYPISERKYLIVSRRRQGLDNIRMIREGESILSADSQSSGNKECAWLSNATVIGSCMAIIGCIAQFVSLWGLHWSVSVMQPVLMVSVSVIRVLIRHEMANPPPSSHLTPGFEYDWFAVHLGNLGEAPWVTGKAKVGPCGSLHGLAQDKQFLWYVRTGEPDKATFTQREGNGWLATDESAAQDVLTIRQNLASLGRWPGSATNEAIRLARAIESAANAFLQTAEPESMCYVWQLPVTYTTAATLPQQPQCEHVSIKLFPTREGWKINAREIEAILSLWSYSAHKAEAEDASDSCQNLGHEETELCLEGECRMGLRLLDRTCTKKRLLQDLRWWLPELDLKIFEVKYTTPESSAAGSAVKKKVCRQRMVGVGESELANSASFGEVLHFFSRDADEGDQSDAETDLDFGNGTLAVQSFDTLERLFSRELFHSFIRTIAKRKDFHMVESVMPELSFEGQDTGNESFKFSNGDLSDLAAKISSEGWGTLPEMLFELIMPLSIESKLSGVKAIVKEAQEKAQRHEMACEWVELAKMCQWLFDLAAKSDLSLSSWCVQAWAVCIHFFYKLVCEGKLMRRESRRTADELDALLEQLKGEFRTSLTVSQFLELLKVRGEREKADVVAEALQISLEGAGVGFSESFSDSFEMNSAHLWTLGRASEPLSDKASHHLRDAFGCYPIHYASLLSSKEMIDSFVRDSQSCSYGLDSRDIFGWTALHYACLRGDEPIVASLLESNGHGGVSIVGNDGVLPMHCAARSGHTRAGLVVEKWRRRS